MRGELAPAKLADFLFGVLPLIVFDGVFFGIDQLQILYPVVAFIAIDVMDKLKPGQFSPDMPLHDHAMFVNGRTLFGSHSFVWLHSR